MGYQLTKEAAVVTPSTNIGEIFYHKDLLPPGLAFMADDGELRRVGYRFCKLTADGTQVTSASLVNLTGLLFTVKSGFYYNFRFTVIFQVATTATNTSIKLALLLTNAPTVCAATVKIPGVAAGDGTGGEWQGVLSTFTGTPDSVAANNSEAITTDYAATIEGTLVPSADDTLQVQYARGGSTANGVTPRKGSNGMIWGL